FDLTHMAKSSPSLIQHLLGPRASGRLSVTCADGTLTWLRGLATPVDKQEVRARSTLTPRGGSSNSVESRMSLWLWPLPVPGPVKFTLDLPALGIGGTVSIDGENLPQAAGHARRLW